MSGEAWSWGKFWPSLKAQELEPCGLVALCRAAAGGGRGAGDDTGVAAGGGGAKRRCVHGLASRCTPPAAARGWSVRSAQDHPEDACLSTERSGADLGQASWVEPLLSHSEDVVAVDGLHIGRHLIDPELQREGRLGVSNVMAAALRPACLCWCSTADGMCMVHGNQPLASSPATQHPLPAGRCRSCSSAAR